MKHFTYIEYDLTEIMDLSHKKGWCFNDILADCFIGAGDYIYEHKEDYLHGSYGVFNEAIELLTEKYQLTELEVKSHKDLLEGDILRALSDSYASNVEAGACADTKDKCETLSNENNCSGWYFINEKGNKCELYEAEAVRFYLTEKDFWQHYGNFEVENYSYTKQDVKADRESVFAEAFDFTQFNWEHFDYYGQRFDSDGWQDYLLDYNEAIHDIEKERLHWQVIAEQTERLGLINSKGN